MSKVAFAGFVLARVLISLTMLVDKVEEIVKYLEQEELDQTDHGPRLDLYTQLFAAYLFKKDLASARYLWKRIPQSTRTGSKELEKLHEVYIAMWNNRSGEFFKALTFTWSANIQPIMSELEDKVREDVLNLVGRAYTSIFEDVLAEMANISPEKVKTVCDIMGWSVEESSYPRLIYPKKKMVENSVSTTSEDQLYILTEFVSFLEN